MSYSNVIGATPLVTGLASVKAYLDTHKANDTYKSCRQKFVILVSDGADTTSCGGAGYDTQADQYKRRRRRSWRRRPWPMPATRSSLSAWGARTPPTTCPYT